MTPETPGGNGGQTAIIPTAGVTMRMPADHELHIVGDRHVPSPIQVDIPGAEGEPGLRMLIEVVGNIPRCTELTLKRVDGGREIRPKDLRAIDIDSLVEAVVAMCSPVITRADDDMIATVDMAGAQAFHEGVRTIQKARKGDRRPMTPERLQRVAEIYNGQETGGIEAVAAVFGCSRSTAIRHINKARAEGLIAGRQR